MGRGADGGAAIEARELQKRFSGGVDAVAGIDLAVREGEIFGFLGPNGAGKTTTVRILTTLLRPSGGSARVGGVDVVERPEEVRLLTGVALQEVGLHDLATGRETLVLQARLYGMRGQDPGRRAGELLELVGLADAADRYVKTYSGGMRRRLDLACALVHGPRILFLDEPTAGLDPASRRAVWEEVQRLSHEHGVTVFLTTQYMEEADRLADRVAIIDHGWIVAEGTSEALKAEIAADVVTVEASEEHLEPARRALEALRQLREVRPDRRGLTLFVANGSAAVADVVRTLDAASIPVGTVSLSSPTLDDVFLRATGARLEGQGDGGPGGDGR